MYKVWVNNIRMGGGWRSLVPKVRGSLRASV